MNAQATMITMSASDKKLLDQFGICDLYCNVIKNATENRNDIINVFRNVKLAVDKLSADTGIKLLQKVSSMSEWKTYLINYLKVEEEKQSYNLKCSDKILSDKRHQLNGLHDQIYKISEQAGSEFDIYVATQIYRNYVSEYNAVFAEEITDHQKTSKKIAICDQYIIRFNRMLGNVKGMEDSGSKISINVDVEKTKTELHANLNAELKDELAKELQEKNAQVTDLYNKLLAVCCDEQKELVKSALIRYYDEYNKIFELSIDNISKGKKLIERCDIAIRNIKIYIAQFSEQNAKSNTAKSSQMNVVADVIKEKAKPKIAKPTWHDKVFNELHDHQLGMMHHANI